jgi:hypothetical protein
MKWPDFTPFLAASKDFGMDGGMAIGMDGGITKVKSSLRRDEPGAAGLK